MLALLIATALVLLVPACGGDDDKGGTAPAAIWQAPSDMEGNWNITMVMRDHETQQIVEEETFTSPICTGDAAVVDMGSGVACDIDPTDDGFRMDCRQTDSISPDCNLVMDIELDFDCAAESICGTGTATGTFSGSGCGELSDVEIVMDITVDGEKIGPPPDGACDRKSLGESLWDALRPRLLMR